MPRIRTAPVPQSNSLPATGQGSNRAAGRGLPGLLAMSLLSAAAAIGTPAERPRETVVKLVAQIQKADYEGNRAALQRLYADLEPFIADEKLASRVRYWRGFALWRRAINGFNDSADPQDLEHDLRQAIAEFKESFAKDPAFVDAQVGTISCLGNLMYLALGHTDRVQELLAQSIPLVKEVRASHPDNPRFVWVLGPILWNTPAEHGGGQDKAIESYLKGLESARNLRGTVIDPLEPSWGEPELLMSLAWSTLNRAAPDLNAADQYAHSALALVPYWHYVRDILLPQLQTAKAAAKPKAPPPGPMSSLGHQATGPERSRMDRATLRISGGHASPASCCVSKFEDSRWTAARRDDTAAGSRTLSRRCEFFHQSWSSR